MCDGGYKFLGSLFLYLFTFFSSAFLPQQEALIANYKKVAVRLLKAKEVSLQLNDSISFILLSPQNFSPAM